MKQAIEFLHQKADHLIVGPRRKQPHSSYILVHEGLALIRLGKLELPVCKGQGFWLPTGCLSAVTILQGSVVSTLDFSVRSTVVLPNSAGYALPSLLIQGIAQQLNLEPNGSWFGAHGRLLRCARDYLSTVSPNDRYDANTLQLAEAIAKLENLDDKKKQKDQNIFQLTGFSEEQIALQLSIRDCVKKLKSGQKLAKIAQQASMPEQELMLLIEKTVGAI
ncbi:hypothetical protein GCE9029_02979 [Grimontia celer]|uniref:AraC family transcriptional regulator n=1 Tax=Grimontia celer TaxID=1796497 RepID=A0A128F5H8_9GAMM|nr:hypothetical protein [Grimontia celer]CZF82018.1 hypothetical protein GCE9029_02979 [Grimontia celer]